MYFAIAMLETASAEEPITLIGTMVKWRYPNAEIGKSEMSDAATIAADGNEDTTRITWKQYLKHEVGG